MPRGPSQVKGTEESCRYRSRRVHPNPAEVTLDHGTKTAHDQIDDRWRDPCGRSPVLVCMRLLNRAPRPRQILL